MMPRTRRPDDPHGELSLARLAQLLDAYGAALGRWPHEEREAARRLIDASPVARARWEDAADLDRLLDTVPSEAPSSLLAARVLAAAPRPRAARVWRRTLAAAVPIAAAAAVTLWIVTADTPVPEPIEITAARVGEYASPTDVLLGAYGVDVFATVPSIGCGDSQLGCPELDVPDERSSQRPPSGRMRV